MPQVTETLTPRELKDAERYFSPCDNSDPALCRIDDAIHWLKVAAQARTLGKQRAMEQALSMAADAMVQAGEIH